MTFFFNSLVLKVDVLETGKMGKLKDLRYFDKGAVVGHDAAVSGSRCLLEGDAIHAVAGL